MEMNFNKRWRQKKQKPSILPSIARHLLDHRYHKGKNASMLIIPVKNAHFPRQSLWVIINLVGSSASRVQLSRGHFHIP